MATDRLSRRRFLALAAAGGAALVAATGCVELTEAGRRVGVLAPAPTPACFPEGSTGPTSPAVSSAGALIAAANQAIGHPTVAIVRGTDPAALVREAVALAGGLAGVVKPGVTVVLKPNLTIPSESGKGNVTDARVVAAMIELCQEAGATRIVVADGAGGGDTTAIMRKAGYEPILQATGATFVDLNADEMLTRRLPNADGLTEYRIAKTVAEAPVLISLPVLKVHRSATITLAAKNLIGVIALDPGSAPRQNVHNAGVQKVASDLVRVRAPDFALIDGIVGLEGDSPMYGTPVPMGLIVAGRSTPSVDAIGAAIMGVDPLKVEQLQLLRRRGVGETDPAKITVRGESVQDVKRVFAM